jgi:hypothetical protein
LEGALDIHSSKYQYASLYGEMVNEWLSATQSQSGVDVAGRQEMHDQRVQWEDYVFNAHETDTTAIKIYLDKLFNSSKIIKEAFSTLTKSTKAFEKQMFETVHFDETSLKWVIKGILRSDLVTDEKRKVLRDFLGNDIVLQEIADVLNMRMSSLDKWKWDPQGTFVEQRRQLNGRYRFYHDEDLLQTILLRYIGVKWAVFFKNALERFQSTHGVWKASAAPITATDKHRQYHFLGREPGLNVESTRENHFKELFLEQLQGEIVEQRGGYDDDSEDLMDTRKSPQEIAQGLLHVLASEIIMKTRLGEDICVIRSDFKWFGPSLPHSTMLAVLKIFNVSDKWTTFFKRALEAPMKFLADGENAAIRIRKFYIEALATKYRRLFGPR